MAMRRVAADEFAGQDRAAAGLEAALEAIDAAVTSTQTLIDGIRTAKGDDHSP